MSNEHYTAPPPRQSKTKPLSKDEEAILAFVGVTVDVILGLLAVMCFMFSMNAERGPEGTTYAVYAVGCVVTIFLHSITRRLKILVDAK